MRHFLFDTTQPEIVTTWALGTCAGDLALLQIADPAFAIATKSPELRSAPGVTHLDSVAGLLALVPNHELVNSDVQMAASG